MIKGFFEARNRELSHEMIAKGAVRGRGGVLYFFKISGSRGVEWSAVAI